MHTTQKRFIAVTVLSIDGTVTDETTQLFSNVAIDTDSYDLLSSGEMNSVVNFMIWENSWPGVGPQADIAPDLYREFLDSLKRHR